MQSGHMHNGTDDGDALGRFSPFEDPVATDDGYVFDILNIMPYIQTFKKHPVTGAPLKVSDLTKLTVRTFSCCFLPLQLLLRGLRSLRESSQAGVVKAHQWSNGGFSPARNKPSGETQAR
jgi:hypothetical protein